MLLVTLWLPCRGTYEIVQSIGRFFMMASRYLKPCESVRVCVESGKGMPSCVRVGKTLSQKVISDSLGIQSAFRVPNSAKHGHSEIEQIVL